MSMDLTRASEIAGFVGACLVDADTGLMLTSQGGGGLDLEQAAALTSLVVQSKRDMLAGLGLDDSLEEEVLTLGKQYHLIRPLRAAPNMFLYVVLDRAAATLGLARLQVKEIEAAITL